SSPYLDWTRIHNEAEYTTSLLAHPTQPVDDFIVRNLLPQTGVRPGKINDRQIGGVLIRLVQDNRGALIAREPSVVDHREIVVADVKGAPLYAGIDLRSSDNNFD